MTKGYTEPNLAKPLCCLILLFDVPQISLGPQVKSVVTQCFCSLAPIFYVSWQQNMTCASDVLCYGPV